jgi:hypothetical protein
MQRDRMTKIDAQNAYFIKLGRGGEWENECLSNGTLRFGYRETPHDLCLQGKWDAVRQFWKERRGDAGTATRDMTQIRAFYEAGEDDLFITFAGGFMHWCRPSGPIELLPDNGRLRRTVAGGWRKTSINNTPLTVDRLSGHLLKVQMFRGTICQIMAFDYLMRKLNDELLPEVAEAEKAERALMAAVIGLMRRLTWQDFELLVDLTFSSSGWRRVSVVGRTQKTVDFDLVLPSTGERAFVQVKAQTQESNFQEYSDRFAATDAYDKMFFVWHTGEVRTDDETGNISLIGPDRLAQMVLDAGLTSWLREKVS